MSKVEAVVLADVLVFRPKTPVQIGPLADPVDAVVLAVSLREDGIQYEVVWWLNGRQTAWLSACEVRFNNDTRTLKIGFHGEQGGGA